MIDNQKLLGILKTLEKYPLEVMFVKSMMLNGIKSEAELIELLKTDNILSSVWKNKLQNAYRDINVSHIYDFNKIPTMFK